MPRPPQDTSKPLTQETAFIAWLQSIRVEIDHLRLEDERGNHQWKDGAVLMPVEDQKLLHALFWGNARFTDGPPKSGFDKFPLPAHEYGAAADTNAARFLHYSNLVMEEFFDIFEPKIKDPEFPKRFAVWIANKAMQNDAELFHLIGNLLERRAQGALNRTSASDVGRKPSAGRQKQPYDLDQTFPIAAVQLLALRLFKRDALSRRPDPSEPIRPYYITRKELSSEIQYYQRIKGKDDATEIAPAVMSRLINQTGLVRFIRN